MPTGIGIIIITACLIAEAILTTAAYAGGASAGRLLFLGIMLGVVIGVWIMVSVKWLLED